jgi:hypothetical protein
MRMIEGRRKMEDGRRKTEDGRWKTEDGRRKKGKLMLGFKTKSNGQTYYCDNAW